MIKDAKYWAEELEKCKDIVYFYNNYVLVNGERPSPITQADIDRIKNLNLLRGRRRRV